MKSRGGAVVVVDRAHVVRAGQVALGPLSLTIEAGQHWVVFGPNGCGKSTLLSLLSGQLWPTEGRISLFHQALGTTDLRKLRRAVGRVDTQLQLAFQQAAYPVEEVVCSGFFDSIGLDFAEADEAQREAAVETLSLLEASHLAERVFRELSYGEQKRILLARALVHAPDLLLFDEPCEGLDVVAKATFLQLVDKLFAQRPTLATVWSSHHLDEISQHSSHVMLLQRGVAAYSGTIDDAFTEERLAQLFSEPVRVVECEGRRLLLLTTTSEAVSQTREK